MERVREKGKKERESKMEREREIFSRLQRSFYQKYRNGTLKGFLLDGFFKLQKKKFLFNIFKIWFFFWQISEIPNQQFTKKGILVIFLQNNSKCSDFVRSSLKLGDQGSQTRGPHVAACGPQDAFVRPANIYKTDKRMNLDQIWHFFY
jgi:hypothetical protein